MHALQLIDKAPSPDYGSLQGNRPNVFYFASPYSAAHVIQREERYLKAVLAAAELGELGFCLIEPIGMSHHSAKVCQLPTGYEYWKRRDRAFIDHSDGVIVLCIDGWFESVGVSDEIAYAFEKNKPVYLYNTNFKGGGTFNQLDENNYKLAKSCDLRVGS